MVRLRLPSGVSRENVFKALDKDFRNKKDKVPLRVAAATIALLTGRRRGEIAALTRDKVNRKKRTITRKILKKKTNTEATLPMGNLLYKYLRKRRNANGRPNTGRVVPGNPRSRSYEFHKRAKRHGRNLRFHDLRHLFALRLVENRTPLPLIRKALQHSDLKVTSVYLEVFAEDLRDIMP